MATSGTVGIRDLKSNLSRHLRHVRAGATLEVTERGRAIATIVPIQPATNLAWAHQLVAEGRAHWKGGKPAVPHRPAKLTRGRLSASDMVLQDRR